MKGWEKMKYRVYKDLKLVASDRTEAEVLNGEELKSWLHYNNYKEFQELSTKEIYDKLRSLSYQKACFPKAKVFSANGTEVFGMERFNLEIHKMEEVNGQVYIWLVYGIRHLRSEYKI